MSDKYTADVLSMENVWCHSEFLWAENDNLSDNREDLSSVFFFTHADAIR